MFTVRAMEFQDVGVAHQDRESSVNILFLPRSHQWSFHCPSCRQQGNLANTRDSQYCPTPLLLLLFLLLLNHRQAQYRCEATRRREKTWRAASSKLIGGNMAVDKLAPQLDWIQLDCLSLSLVSSPFLDTSP
ncbi:hypothetical protein GALMADRAFT_229704 [Galerina marginata CBS 339.88]|uniref:Uncharacterized protein n=1 Tax=Galerina marginata (strain CBS 339.88) TaxID=685588 RepID=A0A067SLZ8_GALM3|nr:hypothetical protein GALMADRAFT_229704 [Galerina marginata CBS 339.88]